MGGDAAKDESSEEDPAEEDNSKDNKDSGCSKSSENEQEGQGCIREAVDEVWEEFSEMTKSQGKCEDDAKSTNQAPTVKTMRASSSSSG
ncbi:hypothetical protein M0R45_007081 [Rubus argutus]|uniref:Uncharacterized protein n=1 Tax=Rubus argutus TaxID=59490 RepID=A0AAW1YST7_RUBAR